MFSFYQKKGLSFLHLESQTFRITEISYFPWCSSLTVSFFLPWALREANTLRPFLVDIRSRKPCLFTRRRLWGWNVLFIVLMFCLLFRLFHVIEVQRYNYLFKYASIWNENKQLNCIFIDFYPFFYIILYLCARLKPWRGASMLLYFPITNIK